MSKEKSHHIHGFMISVSDEMESGYARIQERATQDPGTAGDQAEEDWAAFFKDWLPQGYHIVTKGRILGLEGDPSPQVDVLVLKPSYPKKMLSQKLYMASGVAAAFEIKTTLKAGDIERAVETGALIKRLFLPRYGSPYKELHSPIIYGLLAHSHSWKNPQSKPVDNITSAMHEADFKYVKHPREFLDLICVADLAIWTSHVATVFLEPTCIAASKQLETFLGKSGSVMVGHITYSKDNINQKQAFRPIGSLLAYLMRRLAWENPELRDMANYYRLIKLGGAGSGNPRVWDSSVYSQEIRGIVETRPLSLGKDWDEWSRLFS